MGDHASGRDLAALFERVPDRTVAASATAAMGCAPAQALVATAPFTLHVPNERNRLPGE